MLVDDDDGESEKRSGQKRPRIERKPRPDDFIEVPPIGETAEEKPNGAPHSTPGHVEVAPQATPRSPRWHEQEAALEAMACITITIDIYGANVAIEASPRLW